MSHDTYETSRIKSTMARMECVDDVKGAAIEDSASDNDNPCVCHVTLMSQAYAWSEYDVKRAAIHHYASDYDSLCACDMTHMSVTRVCVT